METHILEPHTTIANYVESNILKYLEVLTYLNSPQITTVLHFVNREIQAQNELPKVQYLNTSFIDA
jgi:hypothetical protein